MGSFKDGSDITEGSEGKEGTDSREYAPFPYQMTNLEPSIEKGQPLAEKGLYQPASVDPLSRVFEVFRF